MCLFVGWYAVNDRVPPLPAEGKYRLSATVCGVPLQQEGKHRTVIELKNAAADGQSIPGRVRMYVYGSAPGLIEGDRVLFEQAKISLPSSRQNPSGFDFARYLKRRNTFFCASAQGDDVAVTGASSSPLRALTLARQRLSVRADRLFASDADVIKAVLLGDRSDLSDALYNDFSTSGLSHLIALSGLHVSAIALMLEALLKLLRLPRGARFACTLTALFVYTLMTGASSSTVRAVLMYALLCAGLMCGYRVDTLSRLALSLLIQLTANPLLIGDTGFVLSYASVTGILCFADAAGLRQKGLGAKLLSGARASFAAQVFTYPLLAGFFYTVPLLGVPVNALCVPLALAGLYLGAAALLIGLISVPAGAVAAVPARILWSAIKWVGARVASWPFSAIHSGAWPWALTAAYLALAFLCSAYFTASRDKRIYGLTALVLICALTLLPAAPIDHLQVTFLDCGNADAAAINAQGHTYLMDCGSDNSVTADYLVSSRAVVSGVFLTHADADHYGGVFDVLERYPSAPLYLPECWDRMSAPEELGDLLYGRNVRYLCAGDSVVLSDDVLMEVLWPPEGFTPPSDNDGSLVARVSYGDFSLILYGDVTSACDALCAQDSDVIKIAHHGSKYATSPEMLSLVTPEIAVISVGSNSYGHPTPEVLQRLDEVGAKVYRTDESGAIRLDVQADGEIRIQQYALGGFS